MKHECRYGALRHGSKAALAVVLLCGTAAADPLEVVALGDSLTQGYGLPNGQGFVPTLQDWLDTRGHDVEVINAGVSGDTTAGGLSRVEWSLREDTDAMIVALGGNDMLRGIAPEVTRANLEGILDVAEARGVPVLLVGLDAPRNYGADYERMFEAIYPELSQAYGTLYYENFFAALGSGDPSAMTRFMQPDGIHPNADGVSRIVDALGPSVEDLLSRAE
ncbi:arylesterase [Roseivivax isoporae]|uniref:GDSL family lipase n=1 Tax=Roseivivax isoporae LMG 25204 TaxID=1449351 RepID=X7FAH4_9RHOB|nr:arylesterase [Roseivivax isoporae]ETX29917.1 GDSL family lipase [Roseivivax isoporae LMG 25204]